MPVPMILTYVPEKRGEVHTEHKLSTLFCPAGTEYSPGGLSLLDFCFIFGSVGTEEGSGHSLPNMPFLRPVGTIRPQHSWEMEGWPGVSSHSRC